MDAKLFTTMLLDKHFCDLKKMQHKYSPVDVAELVSLLKSTTYHPLPLCDFSGGVLVWQPNVAQVGMKEVKRLLAIQGGRYGVQAMEEEIHSTLQIENIDSSRDSIRRILNGYAPKDHSENRIYGMKKGLEFIADSSNRITAQNLYQLYQLTVGAFLEENDQLQSGQLYRHDAVYIVGGKVEHEGLPAKHLPEYMDQFFAFVNTQDEIHDLMKAALIHFYLAYLHPYFDGNGRMARLVHLWYLVQQGYPSALFIPFSKYVADSRAAYYNAYTLVEKNEKISGVLDVTPFLCYFCEKVYNKLGVRSDSMDPMRAFQNALGQGQVTAKEKDLWNFVLSTYGDGEFSTKQLERDFSNAAYATIRGFVLKFTRLGLLHEQRYGNRAKYKIITV